jgi:hypothetical protein
MASRELGHDRVKLEVTETLVGIDEQVAAILEAQENVNRLEQCHVLDDQRIRRDNGLAQPNFLHIDPTEGDDRSSHALGTKAWKGPAAGNLLLSRQTTH